MLSKLAVALASLACLVAVDAQVFEQIVAKVNSDIVTRGDLDRARLTMETELRQQAEAAGQKVPPQQLQEALTERRKDLLKDEIDRLLLVQKGKDLNISVDAEVTKQLSQMQVETKITDPDKFQQYIREMSGMPYEDFKQQLKNNYVTQRVIRQEVGGRINIPKSDLQKYYEENKKKFIRKEQVFLREIFLSTAGKTPAQVAAVEKKAKDLVARARKGEKFHELAKDHSEMETAKNFGEIGWYKRGELRPEFEAIAFKEKRNYVSDPIKLENGFEIIKIEERHEEGQAPFEDVENEIMEILYMPIMQPKIKEYLTKLRLDAFLEIREGFVDTGAAPGKDTGWRDPAQLKPETTTKAEVAAHKKKKLLWVVPDPWSHGKAVKEPEAPATPAPKK